MKSRILIFVVAVVAICSSCTSQIDVAIITGQTDKFHSWEVMTDCLQDVLAEYPKFNTEVILMPKEGEFNPKFSKYDVVVLQLNNVKWSDEIKANLEAYVSKGGGLVILHEADNAFPEWKEFNRMIGLGGWGGRTEKDGPYYYWKDGEYVRDMTSGKGGSHGPRVPYDVVVRNAEHPITKGMPAKWTQIDDELYSNLRGPAENIEVLATAYSTSSHKEEPVIFTIKYGKGRVFHSVLGHTRPDFTKAVRENRGFQVSASRGIEWAATGKVEQQNDMDF